VNLYFLVEGRQCERKLYPAWLKRLAPSLRQVKTLAEIEENNYYLISGEGWPSLVDVHLPNAIKDVEDSGRFSQLIVVVDADEDSAEDRAAEVCAAAMRADPVLRSAGLSVIVQFRCIETWLLGNRKAFVRNPVDPMLREYVDHYDCSTLDPEGLPPHHGWRTQAQFHHAYLKAVFTEKGMSYSKSRPGDAATASYLEQLIKRVRDRPAHLASFQQLIDLAGAWEP
jgi:hypothetical protein